MRVQRLVQLRRKTFAGRKAGKDGMFAFDRRNIGRIVIAGQLPAAGAAGNGQQYGEHQKKDAAHFSCN